MQNKKVDLLNTLQHNTFIRLRPSTIEGIGVFATTLISKGQRGMFSKDKSEWIPVTKQEVAALPLHTQNLIENFCLYDEEHYFVPEYGFAMVDLVIFINHSETPNIRSLNDGEDFEALHDIQPGDELLLDYNAIV